MMYLSKFICILIQLYQVCISPFLISRCRFFPTCSEFAKNAFREHNFLFATFLTLRRLIYCHPFSKGGLDPVAKKHRKK